MLQFFLAPFRYRPSDTSEDAVDWEDNWLSNLIAWASRPISGLCEREGSLANRLVSYLWTSCPCCFFLRGASFGAMLSGIAVYILRS